MKQRTFYLDEYNRPLLKPDDGFVIVGNVYVADGKGGLIGNNFPTKERFCYDEVEHSSFSKIGMLKALGFDADELINIGNKLKEEDYKPLYEINCKVL